MANSPNSTENRTTDQTPLPDNPNPPKSDLPDSSSKQLSAIPLHHNPNTNPSNNSLQPTAVGPPPQIQPFAHPSQVSNGRPSFRPAAPPVPLPGAPQFSRIPNPNFPNHRVQPPGVMTQPSPYGHPGQQPMRMCAPMPNGYQMAVPQGTMNPPVCDNGWTAVIDIAIS